MSGHTALESCLACGGARPLPYLDLGSMPLANAWHDGSVALRRHPLAVALCGECFHSQLTVAVDPDLMFRDYLYVSGTTRTLSDYFEDFVDRAERDAGTGAKLRVLDIASNDGSLLEKFHRRGHAVQGVDPAANLRPLSAARGVPTLVAYWNEDARERCGGPFDVIVAMNVLAHIANPRDFLVSCRRALAPGGRIYVQTSQARMVANGEFDTIYHEHHSFFTVRSFLALAARAGLSVVDVGHVPVHGTSYLVQLVAANGTTPNEFDFAIGRSEIAAGYYDHALYDQFSQSALTTRAKVLEILGWARSAGYRVAGYGAAAKGMTFLNFVGLDLDYIVDDNPLKFGLLTPGRDIRLVGPERLERDLHDTIVVILAWNFRDEVMRRIRERRNNKRDYFLTCFPGIMLTG